MDAPIPSSAQFLLVHLLEKASKKVQLKKQAERRENAVSNTSRTAVSNTIGAVGRFIAK